MKLFENKKRAILVFLLFGVMFFSSTLLFAKDQESCSPLFEGQFIKGRFYRRLDRVLKVNESWEFTVAREEEFKAIYQDSSLTALEKHQRLFQSLITARLSGVNPVSAHFLESMVRDVFEQNSFYSRTVGRFLYRVAGPHYNPIANRIVMDPISGNDIRDLVIAMHEIQHGYDRNAKPFVRALEAYLQFYDFLMILPTPSTPTAIYRAESQAIGAQWEFARRIPEDYRNPLIKALRAPFLEFLLSQNVVYLFKNNITKADMKDVLLQLLMTSGADSVTLDLVRRCDADDFNQAIGFLAQKYDEGRPHEGAMEASLTESVLATLEYSKFGREEFLSRLMSFHGYTFDELLADHYRLTPMKGLLIASTIYTLWNFIDDHGKFVQEKALNRIDEFYAHDVRLIIRILSITSSFFLPREDDSAVSTGRSSGATGSNS